MSSERTCDEYLLDEITDAVTTGQTDYIAPDGWYPYGYENTGLPVPNRAATGSADSMEADTAPTLRERLRTYVGRTAAVLALAGATLAGSSLAPDEAEAEARQLGPVACRNNDGTTGVRLGELCLVNGQQYGNAKGPNFNDRAIAFIAGEALGGKCATAFYAGDTGATFATNYALKVYKAGKFVRYSTPAGIAVGLTGGVIGNKVCD